MISKITDKIYIGDFQDAVNLHDSSVKKIQVAGYMDDYGDDLFKGIGDRNYLFKTIGDPKPDYFYPLIDGAIPANSTNLKNAIAAIKTEISKGNKVLVFCMMGQSRSPSTVVAHFLFNEPLPFDYAYNLVRSSRKQALDAIDIASLIASATNHKPKYILNL